MKKIEGRAGMDVDLLKAQTLWYPVTCECIYGILKSNILFASNREYRLSFQPCPWSTGKWRRYHA